jgi:hypothetical protein
MNKKRPLIMLASACLILSALGFLGYFIGGAFGMFVEGMTPGVLAGFSVLMLIVLTDTDRKRSSEHDL